MSPSAPMVLASLSTLPAPLSRSSSLSAPSSVLPLLPTLLSALWVRFSFVAFSTRHCCYRPLSSPPRFFSCYRSVACSYMFRSVPSVCALAFQLVCGGTVHSFRHVRETDAPGRPMFKLGSHAAFSCSDQRQAVGAHGALIPVLRRLYPTFSLKGLFSISRLFLSSI